MYAACRGTPIAENSVSIVCKRGYSIIILPIIESRTVGQKHFIKRYFIENKFVDNTFDPSTFHK